MNERSKVHQRAVKKLHRELDKLCGWIESWKEDMQRDYKEFFLWHADDMYKTELAKDMLEPVVRVADKDNLEVLSEFLRHHVEHLSDDLLNGQLGRTANIEMFNVAHTMDLKAKQHVRQVLYATLLMIKDDKV